MCDSPQRLKNEFKEKLVLILGRNLEPKKIKIKDLKKFIPA
jgi:hypothetical protein